MGLPGLLCPSLLPQGNGARDFLWKRRDPHPKVRRPRDALPPPLFSYEAISSDPHEMALIYDSPRKLCSLLWGAIEGAAERYGERVQVVERSCMKQGSPICRFELRFSAKKSAPLEQLETPEQIARRKNQRQLANLVLSTLPDMH